jgi:hypothetical protein
MSSKIVSVFKSVGIAVLLGVAACAVDERPQSVELSKQARQAQRTEPIAESDDVMPAIGVRSQDHWRRRGPDAMAQGDLVANAGTMTIHNPKRV